jgi:2-keto-4-pentenoate hydratase/2-oxohepta-3-ene-1,7-dioic acid hydratase in catechol pathway
VTQLFQTTEGVARRRDDVLEVLDIEGELHDLVMSGRVSAARTAAVRSTVPLADARFLVPMRPTRLIQVGLNYRSHLDELGATAPETPIHAIAAVTNEISAPGAVVVMPADDPDTVDYEAEIGLVVGASASNIDAADAWACLAAFTVVNDVSARTLQRAGLANRDFAAGKMLPGFKPLGPGLLLIDGPPAGPLSIRLSVNGEGRQSATTDEMVYPIPELVAFLSTVTTLEPGDIIMTGSPSGIGALTGNFLRPGDVTEIWLQDMPPLVSTFAAP